MMKHILLPGVFLLSGVMLSGCALFQGDSASRPTPTTGPLAPDRAAEMAPAAGATTLGAQAVSAAALDQTTPEEKAAALAAPAAGTERELGRVSVALGPPAEQGIWLTTSLVTAPVMGRVVTAEGTSLAVELRPGTGGALLSLAAFQALKLSLTDLPEVTVFGP